MHTVLRSRVIEKKNKALILIIGFLTFISSSVYAQTLYWVRGAGNWNDPTHWSMTSGGPGGTVTPNAATDVVFDVNSFSAGAQTVTVNIATATCRNMTWVDGQLPANSTLALSNNPIEINGNLALARNLAITGTTSSVFNFTSNPAASNTSASRNISCPAGSNASLPAALFNSAGVSWTVNGAGTFRVTNELGLQAGTLNTNSVSVSCAALNANKGGTARTFDLANSAVSITGSNANGFSVAMDFRGSNFTFVTPGAAASLTFTNTTPLAFVEVRLGDNITWGVNPGSPRTLGNLRTMPNIILQSTDVDIYTADYNVTDGVANRTTFRNVTNVNGGMFFIVGTSPHTYGALTVANNLNAGFGIEQRRIVGSTQPSPNNNIFNGAVTFGTNSGFSFEGNNIFNSTFTVGSTPDATDVLQFTDVNVFNGVVDITGNSLTRVTPTVHFGSASGGSTTFNNNVTFRGTAAIFRVSGPATLAASRTMTFDTESIGWFVGGNTTNVANEPIPGVGNYTFAGNLVLNPRARTTFYNTTANSYRNITLNDYTVFEFTSLATSTVTNTFSASGNCNIWRLIGSSIPGDQADVTFNISQTWSYVLARDLNIITGSQSVTANNSTNVGNSCTPVPLRINFTATPTPGTLVWVGGDPSNISGNSLWSDPRNWAAPPLNATNRRNGGTCIPSSLNNVVFDNNSFSNTAASGTKFYDRVIIDIPVATCADMTWQTSIMNGAMLTTNAYTNEMWVHGNLILEPTMNNQFTGTFSFRYPISSGLVEQFIDANGLNDGSSEAFKGPVEINSVGVTYRLESDIVVNAADIGGVRRGNISILNGDLRANGNDINLSGNWIIAPPNAPNPQGTFIHNSNSTVTFDGQDVVNGTQNIVAATSPFWNLVINRGARPLPWDVNVAGVGNTRRWVVIQNKRGIGGNPGSTVNGNQPFDSGITVDNNLTVMRGGLYDNGFQIIGNTTGTLSVTNNGILSIGNGAVNSGLLNNNPLTSLFPSFYQRDKIVLARNSTICYSASGHQDVSAEPIYGALYFRNATPGNVDGIATLTSNNTYKRLSMGTAVKPLTINGAVTIERGILFYDMGSQINVGSLASLEIRSGGTFMLGSGNQSIATTTGVGYDPSSNTTGNTTLVAAATTFPAFTVNVNANSNVVYASSLAQTIRGDMNAASGRRYGNLIVVNPATSIPSLIPKTIQAGPIRVRSLIIHPNVSLVDDGNQINGTSGAYFVINSKSDPLVMPFNGQAPVNSGITTSATPFDFSTKPATDSTNFGYRFDGFIKITNPGLYTFYTTSDDGSLLAVNGVTVVNNNYDQSMTTRSGTIPLVAGTYPISVTYHQGGSVGSLQVEWQGPGIERDIIPSSVVSQTAGGTTGGVNFFYYKAPAGIDYNIGSGYNSGSLPLKTFTNLNVQAISQTTTYEGESRLVAGNATTATLFPANYTDADLTFDEGTTVIYNAGVSQTVRGLNSTTPAQQYANLVLTNPVAAAPRVVSKTLAGPATVRQSLTINPNNNLIDNGNQLSGTAGQAFTMRNATLAPDPLTNAGTAGAAGESRITIGNATTATLFPLNYSLTATDVNFELGTTVVYNAGIVQPIAALQSATATSRYANLMLTNPATVPASGSVFPIVKTLQNSITVRGTITVNPNNTLADGGFQLSGTFGSAFNMYNATLTQTVVPETGATTGSAGESRFVINSVNSGTVRTFPTGLRTGAPGGSDINFETGTTVVYNANANQTIQGLGGIGNTTYANLVLSNPVASSATLISKTLTSNGTLSSGTTVRGTLTVNPNVNLVDGGFQLGGVAGQTFRMRNTTLADNLLRVSTGDATTVGTTGASRLTLGTATVATSFPTGYVTLESTDINFELGTTVVYNAGVAQAVRGIFHSSVASNANYANVSFVNPAASGTVTKTIGTSMRVRQNLTIGGVTAATASGAANQLDASIANCKINLGGNWLTHPGNGFHARAGEVELEGSSNQTITTQNTQAYSSELTTQDFYNLRINNTTALPAVAVTLASNVGVAGTMIFQRGLVQSASLSGAGLTVSPASGLLIIRHNGTASSASDNSFVLGAVRKVGQVASGTFFFPVGYLSGSTPYYRPSGISAMSDNSGAFISQFYFQHPSSAGFNTTLLQTTAVGVSQPLRNVSVREFWMVNRENSAGGTAFVSLTWRNPESGGVGTNGVATNYLGLRVARWNGSLWQNLGGDVTKFAAYNGSLNNTNGSLTSQYNTAGAATNPVNSFSPFTLASEIDFNPLPVTLLDFAAQPAGGQVKLSWQTASERNTAHFVVQRSADGKSFERVGQVPAKGNSAELALYQSLDTDPYTGLSYYRLQMVDLDGSVSYSKVVRVNLGVGGGLGETVLFPNPTDGRTVNIRVGAGAKVVAIHDMLGRRVAYRSGWNGDGSLAVDFVQVLAKGTYVAVVLSADGSQTARVKFVVQ